MANVIQVAGVGKQYTLTHRQGGGYLTLRDTIADSVRGLLRPRRRSAREQFWALRDVSFEIQPGERVGIIGRNGAGKSTLLKILSRITPPSMGRVEIEGRVASLLEVGSGFHPELTGRENIFINGAILGMPRAETNRKFDGIVAFAGVERFVDTPVKHYSSGMYVRLAFAVAAHVEPDILIVDEVLAVGDAQFQKKSLESMSRAAAAGKTVLFVSHNLAAIRSLTSRTIVLDDGRVAFDGPTEAGLAHYTAIINEGGTGSSAAFAGRGHHSQIHSVTLTHDPAGSPRQPIPGEIFRLEVDLSTDGTRGLSVDAVLFDAAKTPLALFSLSQLEHFDLPSQPGRYVISVPLRAPLLASGTYTLDVMTSTRGLQPDHYVRDAASLDIQRTNGDGFEWDFRQSDGYGVIALKSESAIEVRPKPNK